MRVPTTTSIDVGSARVSLSVLADHTGVTGRDQLKLCWVTIAGPISVFPRFIGADWQRARMSYPGDVVVVNGPPKDAKNQPIGLLFRRTEGDRGKSPALLRLKQGGLLVQTPAAFSIRQWSDPGSLEDAVAIVQTDLLLVEHGEPGVKAEKSNHVWNRAAIALTDQGTLVVLGAFAKDGRALTLLEFARALVELRSTQKLPLQWAMNLDGAYAPFIAIPSLKQHFGADSLQQVNSTIHFR